MRNTNLVYQTAIQESGEQKPIIPSLIVLLYLLDSISSFQIPSQNIYRRFIHIASKTSDISKYIHDEHEWELCTQSSLPNSALPKIFIPKKEEKGVVCTDQNL